MQDTELDANAATASPAGVPPDPLDGTDTPSTLPPNAMQDTDLDASAPTHETGATRSTNYQQSKVILSYG